MWMAFLLEYHRGTTDMAKLTHLDTLRILDSVAKLNREMSKTSLPQRVFAAVSNCVEADITALDGFGEDTSYTGRLWYDPVDSVTNEQLETFAAHTHEHPFFVGMLVDKKSDVMKITDYLSNSQFHSTGIYNEFYKKVGVERQMAFAMDVNPRLLVTCALSRTRKDFNERERAVLAHLSPHLIAAFRNTQVLDRVQNELASLRGRMKSGLVISNQRGDVRFINQRAADLLQRYFGSSSKRVLPEPLRRYLDSQSRMAYGFEYYEPPAPLELKGHFATLRVQVSFYSQTDDITVVLEEHRERNVEDFQLPELSRREAEMLFWISKGKTDSEIAGLCSISIRTVQKHIENVFAKLGVETRTAAVMAALERCSDHKP